MMSEQPNKSAIRYFGDYILLGEIARGGMGVVYHALQTSLDREVAIKMIDAGNLAGEAAGRRFQTEAEAMAQLDHPHIVSIYEVGEHEGQRYLAMKLIEGNSLAEQIAEGRWNINANNRKERQQAIARLMATVAEAVHHAHQRGVLHRDIKPGNILLDEEGEPHVTDFGLAKLTENDVGLSQTGAVLGTPSYMAPEQAAGKTRQITTATDVYALGVVLYELLTGERPFHADDVIEVLKMVVQQEPRRPRSHNPLIDRDLETICLKCLEKSSKNRYHTAEELANDLERWNDGNPILARPSTTAERIFKWVKRRPAIAGLSAAVLLLFFAVAIGSPIAVKRISAERDRANLNATAKEESRKQAEADRTRADDLRRTAEGAQLSTQQQLYRANMSLIQQAWEKNQLGNVQQLLDESAAYSGKGFEWAYWQRQMHMETRTLRNHDRTVGAVAYFPDGLRIVTGSWDSTAKVWDANTGKELFTLTGHKGMISSVAVSPDGQKILTIGSDGTLKI